MYNRILKTLGIAVGAIILTGFSRMSDHPDCVLKNDSFKEGEELLYKVYYQLGWVWVPAGEARFRVRDAGKYYEMKVTAKTFDSYDWFFRVRDTFTSKIDKEKLLPQNFVRKVHEGNYHRFDSLVFHQSGGFADSYNGKTKKIARKKTFYYDGCMHDLLSVFYFLRNIDVARYQAGDYIPVKMLMDEKIYPIKVRYKGKEKSKEIKELGIYNTIVVVPDLITGNVFKEGNKMTIWVSDDKNKIPLLIESPLSVGHAKAVLSSIKGNRYIFTSKVKGI